MRKQTSSLYGVVTPHFESQQKRFNCEGYKLSQVYLVAIYNGMFKYRTSIGSLPMRLNYEGSNKPSVFG